MDIVPDRFKRSMSAVNLIASPGERYPSLDRTTSMVTEGLFPTSIAFLSASPSADTVGLIVFTGVNGTNLLIISSGNPLARASSLSAVKEVLLKIL